MSRPAVALAALAALAATGCGIDTRTAGESAGSSAAQAPPPTGTTPPPPSRRLPQRASGLVAVEGPVTGSLTPAAARQVQDVRVDFQPVGEAQAFRDLCAGRVDVVDSARLVAPSEERACRAIGLSLAAPIQVASDAVVVATKNETDVGGDCLREANLREIFRSGSPIDNWSQLGFFDLPLRVTGPTGDSSVFAFFAQQVLGLDRNATPGDLRSDYIAHSSFDAVRREVTRQSAVDRVTARFGPRIRRLQRASDRELQRQIDAAVARAKRRLDDQVAQENAVLARRRTPLTPTEKLRIAERHAREYRKATQAAIDRVRASYFDVALALARRDLQRRLRAVSRAGTVGIFPFTYYELYENQLRPLEIWDPATARVHLAAAGVSVTSAPGAAPVAPGVERRVNPQTTPWCVFPSQTTVTNTSYPLARPLLLYVTQQGLRRGEVKRFLRAYLESSRSLATTNRFVPIPDAVRDEELAQVGGQPRPTTQPSSSGQGGPPPAGAGPGAPAAPDVPGVGNVSTGAGTTTSP